MKTFSSFASLLAVATLSSFTWAEEPASTTELPAALAAVGYDQAVVISDDEAHTIRGTSKSLVPIFQAKQFQVVGEAVGTTTLLEGVFGQFVYKGQNGLEVQATFGGLNGEIAVSDGSLHFDIRGKALQETLQFAGEFQQIFTQTFGKQ